MAQGIIKIAQEPDWKDDLEVCRITMPYWFVQNLYDEGCLTTNSPLYVEKLGPWKEEYPDDPKWVELDLAARQGYRDKKQYEEDKRNEQTNDEGTIDPSNARPF